MFLDQVTDPLIKLIRFPGLVAAAGQPWMSPSGMLQPKKVFMGIVPTIPYNSRLRYHNHFTYILSTTNHLGGTRFGYDGANDITTMENTPKTGNLFTFPIPDPCSASDCKTNNEEVRILTNRRVFVPFGIGAGGDAKPRIEAACKPFVREIVRGRGIKLFRIGHRERYLWIWKRRYHLIEGWETRVECDYVYNNVLCNTQAACPGACCCGSTCSMLPPTSCVGPNTRYAGNGTVCNVFPNVVTPCCFADYNQSGLVSVQDIFDFLAGYFAGSRCADVNGIGFVTVQDIFDFLGVYFAGCGN